jgi:sec-independent protein translocase protein TatC
MIKKLLTPFRLLFQGIGRFFSSIGRGFRKIFEFFSYEEEDTPLPDAFAKTIQNPVGIFYHVNELRKHLFRMALYMVAMTALSFVFIQWILEFLSRPLPGGLGALQAVDVTEPVGSVMKVALLGGFTLSFPLLIFEIWLFAAPGLKRGERIFSLLAIPFALIFFVGGMAFAYFIMLPVALPFLLSFQGIHAIPRPNSYFPFVTNMLFWLGVGFEFPLVILVLARLGVVHYKDLAKQWRIAIVIIAAVAAIVTTTVDPVNMMIMMAPLTILYFLSIGFAFFGEQKRHKPEEETEAE